MVLKLQSGHDFYTENVGGVMFLNLCTSCDQALYLQYISFVKISRKVLQLLSGQDLLTKINNCRRSYGTCSLHID